MLVCICIIHMIHVKYRKITFTMMKLQKNFLESDYSKVPEPPGVNLIWNTHYTLCHIFLIMDLRTLIT